MQYDTIRQLQIDDTELSRHDDELIEFIAKYSKNHVEVKMIVNGYELISESGEKFKLDNFSLTTVFPHEQADKFSIIYKKIEILEAILAFIFDTPKDHSIRVSAGSGTLFPLIRKYNYDGYMMSMAWKNINLIEDWNIKRKNFIKYSDYFLEHEINVHPIIWYKKGVLSNDNTSAFLHYYRCLEVLSKLCLEKVNKEIRKVIEENLDIKSKSSEIQKRFSSIGIPKNITIPFFLEENGIKKETYKKWRKFRNKLTHGDFGDLSFEFNEEFRQELLNLKNTTRKLLGEKIDQLLILEYNE